MTSSSQPSPSVVTPGNHDGVHLGHQALVAAARERAARDGSRALAMFFDPHPTRLLTPERAPALLTMPPRRAELLLAAGADDVVIQPFDRAFSQLPARRFAEDVLVRRHGARGVVVGPDFRFGQGRTGNVELLRTLGGELGFDVIVVPPVMQDGVPVSSSRVRRLVEEGDVETAARLLGRYHEVDGTVVRGDRRGRQLGFPTANLDCDPVLLPQDGIYAVVARPLEGAAERLDEVASLGVRPTFDAGRSIEVHLFDFDGDLYDARMRVAFVQRIREERRFDDAAALIEEMERDAARAREALAHADEGRLAWL